MPRQAEVALWVPGRLTLNLLTTTIVAPPSNASKLQMGFNSAFKGLRPPDLLDFRHYKGGRSSAKRTGRLYPRRNPLYSLSEADWTSGHMVLL